MVPAGKNNSQVVFVCPYFYQTCYLRMILILQANVDVDPVLVERIFEEFNHVVNRNGLFVKFAHKFGILMVWPKEFGFQCDNFVNVQKWRPISSYSGHVLKQVCFCCLSCTYLDDSPDCSKFH